MKKVVAFTMCALLFTACQGGGAGFFPGAPGASGPVAPSPTLSVTPSTVRFNATGQTQNVTIADSGYTGTFTVRNASPDIATGTIVNGSTVQITSVGAGQTSVTVGDSLGHNFNIIVSVTITNGTIAGTAHRVIAGFQW